MLPYLGNEAVATPYSYELPGLLLGVEHDLHIYCMPAFYCVCLVMGRHPPIKHLFCLSASVIVFNALELMTEITSYMDIHSA